MARMEARQPRRPIVGPVILIALGVLFLLSNLGYLTWGFWGTLWQFWPVILILFGIELLLGRSHPWVGATLVIMVVAVVIALSVAMTGGYVQPLLAAGPVASEFITEEMGGIQRATVDIDFGAGEIVLGSLPEDSTALVEAEIAHGASGRRVSKQFSGSNGQGNLQLRSDGRPWAPFGNNFGDYWSVKLSQNLPLSLRLKTGASQGTVDLSDLSIEQFRVEVGAASVGIKLPRQGFTQGSVKAGAADVTIEVPDGVAAKIQGKMGVGSLNIDEARFPKRGSYYVSTDFDSSDNRVELDIDGGVASVTVR